MFVSGHILINLSLSLSPRSHHAQEEPAAAAAAPAAVPAAPPGLPLPGLLPRGLLGGRGGRRRRRRRESNRLAGQWEVTDLLHWNLGQAVSAFYHRVLTVELC